MKHVSHIEKRGKWTRADPNSPRECCACGALSDRRLPMPTSWSHHMVDQRSVFACSTLCRLQKGLKA
jgi:hypothetical protein